MKAIKLKSLRIYDAINVNKGKEGFLIDGGFIEGNNYVHKKYVNLRISFLPEISAVEVKDVVTKYHILVPVTNVAEMVLPESEWNTYSGRPINPETGEPKRGPGRPPKDKTQESA